MQSHKHFLVGLYKGALYTEPLLGFSQISRKRNGMRQKTMLLWQNAILLLDSRKIM